MPARSKRDELIDTALTMFSQDGFHSTGINSILEKAGVAKMTLYKHFKSKDDLVIATLRRRDEQFRQWFTSYIEAASNQPEERLLAVFDALDLWFNNQAIPGEKFRGCTFINAAAEYEDSNSSVRSTCAEHKRLMRGYIRGLAEQAGVKNAEQLSEQLNLLIEGAITNAYVCHDTTSALTAKNVAESLLKQATHSAPDTEQ